MNDKEEEKIKNPDRRIQYLLLWVGIVSMVLLIITLIVILVGQYNTDRRLAQIAGNTYPSQPYLIMTPNCYIMNQDYMYKYFGVSNQEGYVEVFNLKASNKAGTNPWIKVILPSGLSIINATTYPKVNLIRSNASISGTNHEVISVQWNDTLSPAAGSVNLLLWYNTNDLNLLKSQYRQYSYGVEETNTYSSSFNCYGDINIFSGSLE